MSTRTSTDEAAVATSIPRSPMRPPSRGFSPVCGSFAGLMNAGV